MITERQEVATENRRAPRGRRQVGLQGTAFTAVLATALAFPFPGAVAAQTVTLAWTELEVYEDSNMFEVLAPDSSPGRFWTARMVIRRSGDLSVTTRGRLVFHPGSATEGEDYLVDRTSNWTIVPGEDWTDARLPHIVHDGLAEDAEDFFVELVVDQGGVRAVPHLARVTILDRPRIEVSIESLPPTWGGFTSLHFPIEIRNLGEHQIDEAVLRLELDERGTLRHDVEECETVNEGWSPMPGGRDLERALALGPWEIRSFRACVGVGLPEWGSLEHLVAAVLDPPKPARRAIVGVDHALQPCLADPASRECCVARAIACFLHPTHCDGATIGGLLHAASKGFRRVAGLVPRFFQLAGDVGLLYRVRHELERTAEGRRLVDLYYQQSQALKETIFGDLDLLFETSALLDAWRHPLEALAADEAEKVVLSHTQIDRLVAYLDALEAAAGPELQEVIARERMSHDFEAFAGLTVGEALTRATTPPPAPCVPSSEVACLLGGRFEVRVDWQTAEATGTGKVMSFGGQRAESDESVFMWFFAPENFEMGIKMVDACVPPFDKFWAFQSGLTNQGYTVRIRDTVTDAVRTYSNPRGTLPTTTADTSAFDCP